MRLECLENKINEKNAYIGYINYADLVKFSFLKPLTVNRLTDEKRIEKMTFYIEKQDANYPPIVVAVEEGCSISYNSSKNELIIEKSFGELHNNRLAIIDGQHRYLSIKNLIDMNKDNIEIKNRRQAIYILTDLTEVEQRKYFMEINENMKKVSSVSKRIFEVNVPNYISLKTIIDLDIVKSINIKNDQCTSMYPYKFIQSGNKILFNNVDYKNYNKDSIINVLNIYVEKSRIIWEEILKFIEENTNLYIKWKNKSHEIKNDYKSIKTEIFIKVFLEKLVQENTNIRENIEGIDNKELRKILLNFIKMRIYDTKYFDYDDKLFALEKISKEAEIRKILSSLGGENNE